MWYPILAGGTVRDSQLHERTLFARHRIDPFHAPPPIRDQAVALRSPGDIHEQDGRAKRAVEGRDPFLPGPCDQPYADRPGWIHDDQGKLGATGTVEVSRQDGLVQRRRRSDLVRLEKRIVLLRRQGGSASRERQGKSGRGNNAVQFQWKHRIRVTGPIDCAPKLLHEAQFQALSAWIRWISCVLSFSG